MEVKINTTVTIPDNKTRVETSRIVEHIQEVLVQIDLGIVKKDRESIKNAILGEKKPGGICYEYEEAYLTYIPYMFWFYHVDGRSWTIEELDNLWEWTW